VFIDYCGPTVPITDPAATGERHAAQVFVAGLGASNDTYADATWTQGQADWLGAHTRALTFFGGVPAVLVPDNLAAAVRRANRYAPELNPSYAELARHYGTAVLPARPSKPRDKAKAETGVQLVERWILARLRHRTFFSLAELNAAIAELLADLNDRPFAKRHGSRRQLFEDLDYPALQALPQPSYTYGEWKRVKVGIDYHVQIERHGYSVPQRLVGERLDARISAQTVELFHQGNRVACHPRSHRPGDFTTESAHMPEAHRRHNAWQPGDFRDWAAGIGASLAEVVDRQLTDRPHPEHGYRACPWLRELARRFGPERLEAGCAYALSLGTTDYPRIRTILERGLEADANAPAADGPADVCHANVRGGAYYAAEPS
jgi:transposase